MPAVALKKYPRLSTNVCRSAPDPLMVFAAMPTGRQIL
jgi:hypothetical protein